ncbi:MAG: carbohydrate ABC transporter permease [Bacillota bacterium]
MKINNSLNIESERPLAVFLKKNAKALFKWGLLTFFLLYTLLPMVWLVISSLKTNTELMGSPFSLPAKLQFSNYVNAFSVSGLSTLFLNSVIISLSATFLNVIVAAMASFAISRFNFRFKEGLFTIFVTGILVPINALMVPYFTLINKLNLYDKKLGLILTYAAIGIPMSIYIIRGFMNTIPIELEEAAVLEGCSFYKRFLKIIFPLSRTGLVTAGTFQFLLCWNEFIYAMLLTSSVGSRTIQLGVRYFSNQFTTDYTSMYAAIVISIIPSIVGYMIFQDQIISGLTSGAVKG